MLCPTSRSNTFKHGGGHRVEDNPFVDHPQYETVGQISMTQKATVFVVWEKNSHEKVAIKLFRQSNDTCARIKNEIENRKILFHPHVVQVRGVIGSGDSPAIVMEYLPGGNLYRYIRNARRLEEPKARWIFQQLIVGLDYLHRMKLWDRTLKPQNVLLDDAPSPIVKICDMGFTKQDATDRWNGLDLRTLAYMAPEVLFHDEGEVSYDEKQADIWSYGAILFTMLTGRRLYKENTTSMEAYQKCIEAKKNLLETPPLSQEISDGCKDLVYRMLEMDSNNRPSVKEIQQHPWYKTQLPEGALTYNDLLTKK